MSASRPVSERLALAVQLAHRAGRTALAGRRSGSIDVATKSSPTDLVTEFDTLSERTIVAGIVGAFPDDRIVGEEGADRPGSTGFEWHVDPIDGTSNFFYDLPVWAVSIGVVDALGPVAGAVYLPVLDETYTALRGQGALLNGRPIRATDSTDVSTSLVATGFAYDSESRTRHARVVADIIGRVRDIRRHGAASCDLCMVACGRVDAYFERGLHSWDLVAGQLIAEEAGALASDWSGGPITPDEVLVAAPGIHGGLIALLSGALP